ncbi:aminodeoxychorismate lyase [Elizabethkingia meningoseptica]|uniref:aminotransferase class IV n=1 Tax=Elizabethkingia meningoseptica TaxID=238 RepID=UPI000332CA63|nr:aminotransferase class IV [Elizabethkingia meningoseptica]AQX03923.1 aminodeoxychorismate lyase [Elizabethkingia meningoseptica]AQX45963.1 aminodeoxychorismate lyase [Elizabethkingia meningoseptica]EOR29780.1 aminodeoxychorismate lyase [Elizabethkingia meningoseptica ATCC 13253 = NBRC 12535]KUY15255.1 aminodeoxychorismate lyase [Elizabethkingia meningoseptica]OPB69373.1 aminodeoxychorismate lyase [Elizabethkingia meningoseptica]
MTNNFQNIQKDPANRAFLFGDGVWVSFYVRNNELILAEECYFYLMASMRKLRMNIPQSYTLEFFKQLFQEQVIDKGVSNGIIRFFAYRGNNGQNLSKNEVEYYFETEETADVLANAKDYEIDLIKEINVNTNLLSNIHVHSPENIYAGIYAFENDLDDVILLNPNKRIARTSQGNILLLTDNTLRIPKHTEGAYISPLLEAFVTFLDKKGLAIIEEAEVIAFETQKADEVLLISETHGIHIVTKIRNKEFTKTKFTALLEAWQNSFS